MATKSPRINVSFDEEDLEIIQFLSKKRKLSLSSFVKRIVHEWLEEYEDLLLIKKVREREKENNPLISHEEYWDLKK